MPFPVSRQPPRAVSTSLVVGTPASATGAAMLATAGAFVHGRATAHVFSSALQYAHTGLAQTFLVYQRRLGVQALRVVTELHRGTNATSQATVEVESALLAGIGTVAWHAGPGGDLNGGMDGARSLPAPSSILPDYPRHEGFLDVSDLAVGLPSVIVLNADEVGITAPNGIRRLSVYEVPLPVLDPTGAPTTEPGVDAAWTQGGNAIIDGDATSPRGVGRILQVLERGRTHCPLHWQVARNTGAPWTHGSASLASLGLPAVRIRPRAYNGTTGDCRVRFGVVYKYADTAGGTPIVRCTATSVTTGTVETLDLPLSDTAGDWYYDEINGDLPCDGTEQRVALSFSARTNASDTVQIASLVLLGRTV